MLQPVTVLFAYDQRFSMRILLPSPEADTAAKLLQLMSTREVQENHKEARERLEYLRVHGETPYAFSLKNAFPAPEERNPVDAPTR